MVYTDLMVDVRYTDEFEQWWNSLDEAEQISVDAKVGMLESMGIALGDPHSSKILTSQFGQMRELKIQHQGRPYRLLYAFDPERSAVLLIGGDKTGNNRWYEIFVPLADRIFTQYLKESKKE